MIKNRLAKEKTTKYPSGSRSFDRNLHIPVIPLFLSVLFLLSLLLYRNLAFPNTPENHIAAAAEKEKQELPAEKITARDTAGNAAQTETLLDAETQYQYPELPNGCEATSLSIALTILGYPADKLSIAYDYLPLEPFIYENGIYYAPDPEVLYAGDPATSLGFYCLEYPVTVAANHFFDEHAAAWTARSLNTVTADTIEGAIQNGSPIIIWATMDYSDTAQYHTDFTWILSNGETYTPYSNLHCVVVYGFGTDIFYVCDPIEGKLEIEKDILLGSIAALDNHAVYFQNITQ